MMGKMIQNKMIPNQSHREGQAAAEPAIAACMRLGKGLVRDKRGVLGKRRLIGVPALTCWKQGSITQTRADHFNEGGDQ